MIMLTNLQQLEFIQTSHSAAVPACNQVPVLYGTVYLLFMWLYQVGTQEWIYTALNWKSGMAIAFYIALPLLLILSYTIM
jgi:hypothetical protein